MRHRILQSGGSEFWMPELESETLAIVMKPLIFALCVVIVFRGFCTEVPVWQPAPGHMQVPIWPGVVPDAQPAAGPEGMKPVEDQPVAGKPWVRIENVSQPTMTVYSPKGRNTGAAVVVFPGGGYKILAIDLEGTEVADWLTSEEITCVLLKYRVPFSGPYWDEEHNCRVYPVVPRALQDAQRTVSLVRSHAAEWRVDPHKVGVLGFSAGGHVAAAVSVDGVNQALVYYIALKNARVPVEMHLG
ncbi:MAG TPA: alpha/beta hydrolase [Chthoniobacterales bacterium]